MMEKLYVGTMNDGLYIINRPPHPAPVDYLNTGRPDVSVIASFPDSSRKSEYYAYLFAASPELLDALQGVLAEPYGCSLCDSGKPRNEAKGHQPDCPFEVARTVINKATNG